MILIFDLDDTLYPEITYVHSGFRVVAEAMHRRYGWDVSQSLDAMNEVLGTKGRGAVFDELLARNGALSRSGVRECVSLYRRHTPRISLAPAAAAFLRRWPDRPYLITDGNKIVQANKVAALGLGERCKRVFITHRYGLRHAKPSPYCFELVRRLERCDWSDLVYVGDNPAKDFVSLNALGGATVRVLTGEHRSVRARPGYDGRYLIDSLSELEPLLQRLVKRSTGDRR